MAKRRQKQRPVRSSTKRANPGNKGSDHVGKTIHDIIKLEFLERTLSERIADVVATFTGSITFVFLHVVWFTAWIIFNTRWFGYEPLDPFPYTFLTMIVSLEAIYLSTFILISENRQARLGDRRARVNLQVDMISEREVTKLMELVGDIHQHLGIHRRADPELANMQKPTNIEHLTQAAQKVENSANGDSEKAGK
jgi:uncharacterized membrane protein